MRGETQRQRSRERLLRLTMAALDPDELRLQVVDELRRAIGFACWCWSVVDPVSLISTGGISEDLPFLPAFGRYIALMERQADINSYRALAVSRPSVGLLGAATGGDLYQSVRHRDIHAPAGLADELRAVLIDTRGCWGFLNLYREMGERPFEPEDARLVSDVAPALAVALRRSLHRGPARVTSEDAPPGVLILDDDLRVRSKTPAAREWLARIAPPGSPQAVAPLPTPVLAVAARLLGAEAGVDPTRAPRSRVRLAGRQWAVLHAERLEGGAREIAVTIEEARPAEVLDLLSQAWNLSARERQLLELVRAGQDTGQIAGALCISPHTVQDHLKAIFDKVGVHSRRELLGDLAATGER